MINPPPKVDRLPHLIAYGKAYELADGNVDAMHKADVAYYNAETAADAADAAAYSAAYFATLDADGLAYWANFRHKQYQAMGQVTKPAPTNTRRLSK